MKELEEKLPPLEAGLRIIIDALNSQVAREMQRDAQERAKQGESKWEPMTRRVERVSAFLLEEVGESPLELDALLILGQAFSKALLLLSEDLGSEGLGKMRSEYFLHTATQLENDAKRILSGLRGTLEAN